MNTYPLTLNASGRLPDAAQRDPLLAEIQRYEIPDLMLFTVDGTTPEEMISGISQELLWMPMGVVRWEQSIATAARSLALLLQYIHLALPRTRLHLAGHGAGAHVAAAATISCVEPILSTLTLLRPNISPFAFASHGALHRLIQRSLVLGPTVVTFQRKPTEFGMGRAGAHGLDEGQSVILPISDLKGLSENLRRRVINLEGEATTANAAALLKTLCCREDTVPPLRRCPPVRRATRKTASRPALKLVAPRVPSCPDVPPNTESACNAPTR